MSMFGALKQLNGSDMQSFLTSKPTHSWFHEGWPTTWNYGYSNSEIEGVGTQGAGGKLEFPLNELPHDIAGRIRFQLEIPACDHKFNKGRHRRYEQYYKLKDKVVVKKRGKKSSSTDSWSSSSSSSTSNSTSSTSDSSSSSTSESKPQKIDWIDDNIKVLPKHHAYFNQEISFVGPKSASIKIGGVELTTCP